MKSSNIYLAYDHSNHETQIVGTWTIPEYPTPSVLALIMLLTLLFIISYRTKKRPNCP
jgi:hypothetical protein